MSSTTVLLTRLQWSRIFIRHLHVCAFLVLYNAELISTQSHVTAEPHAAKLASLRPTRYLFTETVNVFNRYVAHMAWERVHGSPDSVVIT